MSAGWARLKTAIYSSPLLKTAISLTSSIFIGVFSSSLVTELTKPEGMAWGLIWKSLSFYLLLASAGWTLLFHKLLFNFESDIQKFRDADYCMAYARSRLLPQQIEKYRQKIEAGELEDLNAAMQEIKRVLK